MTELEELKLENDNLSKQLEEQKEVPKKYLKAMYGTDNINEMYPPMFRQTNEQELINIINGLVAFINSL